MQAQFETLRDAQLARRIVKQVWLELYGRVLPYKRSYTNRNKYGYNSKFYDMRISKVPEPFRQALAKRGYNIIESEPLGNPFPVTQWYIVRIKTEDNLNQ